MGDRRVWLITGAGRGLGRAFTESALTAGDFVTATIRDEAALADLGAQYPESLQVTRLDVRDRAAAEDVVGQTVERFGRVDVLVNNAGYGSVGALEEHDEDGLRELLETDLLGTIWTTQAVLPGMRARGAGHIVQISTTGGVGSMPLLGAYNAAKWALEGYSEALAAEVAGFGIRVTIAELGGFDTDWAGSSMRFAKPLPAYDDLRASVFGTAEVPWPTAAADDASCDASGDASSDASPAIAAAALLAHVQADDGPLRLLVGSDAPGQVTAALERRRDDYARNPGFSWPS